MRHIQLPTNFPNARKFPRQPHSSKSISNNKSNSSAQLPHKSKPIHPKQIPAYFQFAPPQQHKNAFTHSDPRIPPLSTNSSPQQPHPHRFPASQNPPPHHKSHMMSLVFIAYVYRHHLPLVRALRVHADGKLIGRIFAVR